jgi:predicted O-methyltransferase YrrM
LARFDELRVSGPSFHGSGNDSSTFVNWQLAPEVLRWLLDTTEEGARTLETGCGYSTVVFAIAGARHTVVSPRAYEHDRVRRWCEMRAISLGDVQFVVGESQAVLPAQEPTPLDLVLIDGDHAFPVPFIDWFFTAGRLREGGLVVVDDTQIRTGALLCEFLASETARWALHRSFDRTAVFMRTAAEWRAPEGWAGQPFCRPEPGRLRSLAHRLRR